MRLPLVHGPDLSGGMWPRTPPVFICVPCGGEAWPYVEHGTTIGRHLHVEAIEWFPPVEESIALSRESMWRQHPEVMEEDEVEEEVEVVAAQDLLQHLRQHPPRKAPEIEGVAAAPEPASASASASEPAGLALSAAQLRAHRLRKAGRRS